MKKIQQKSKSMMIKVLEISTVGLSYEGTTTVIYNYTKNISVDNISIEFLAWNNTLPVVKEKFEKIGEVHTLPERNKYPYGYAKELFALLKNKYDVVHIHGNSGTMLVEVVISKIMGVKRIIVHSHSTSTNYPILDKLMKPCMISLSTDLLACSKEAGEWLFGKKHFQVINNAIEVNRFVYDSKTREIVRNEFGVHNEVLIGHIGHFTPQKNHFFLIEVFKRLHDKHSNTKLLLVGVGYLFEAVQKKVSELGIEDDVIFAEKRSNPERLYQAMDIFVLPSRWEGLGIVLIEAQASSLPVLASSVVPMVAKCTENIEFYQLEKGIESWAEKIWDIVCRYNNRCEGTSTLKEIAKCGYDINEEVKMLEEIYLE